MVELDYTTPFELLVASLLAAQNRDTTINKITPNLFRKYCGPADYVSVDSTELEQDIHLSGFFRQKTKSIKALSESRACQPDTGQPSELLKSFASLLIRSGFFFAAVG